jgi:ribose transport system permease protein
MNSSPATAYWIPIFRDYATLLALLVVCIVLSVVTLDVQQTSGAAAGRELAESLAGQLKSGASVLVIVSDRQDDAEFAAALAATAAERELKVLKPVKGGPADARQALESAAASGERIDAIASTDATGGWSVFDRLGEKHPTLASAKIVRPQSYVWPDFLKTGNLLNIANQIVLIAIVAIGMTMVIVSGGIDLSVGSLIALSAVITARLIRDSAGGVEATSLGMTLCSLAAIVICGLIGAITGTLVAYLRIQPFIVTLAMMLVAAGLASIVSDAQTINAVPQSINWLGGRADLFGIPNAVVLMAILYAIAHIMMSRTTFGRHLYAVGGNEKAAWLCGISVSRVRLLAYVTSGALAGLVGVIMTSTFTSGGPTYGTGYELPVIAAVVVGGTSLAGGEGKMLGTLLGALLIAVVQNGMNLKGVSSDWQKVVLGAVIIAAALLDRAKAAWLPRT